MLVLGGELDSWTPAVDVPKVLAELGGHARFVELANATHVVGQGDTVCGSELVRAFVARPQAIDSLDTSCAAAVPAIHAVGSYPASLAEQVPIEAAAGNTLGEPELQLAAAAVATAGDAIARRQATGLALDHGLHGGTVTATRSGGVLTLDGDRLLADTPVSGVVTLTPAPIALDGDTVTAVLSATSKGVARGSFTATWTTSGSDALAHLTGSVGRDSLIGTLPAP